MIVVGCDPGRTGALYALRLDPKTGWQPASYLLMPFFNPHNRKHPEVDARTVADWLEALPEPPALVAVELVGTSFMPNLGARAGSTDGILSRRAGKLAAVMEVLRLPFREPRPTEWQRACGVALPPRPKAPAVKGKQTKAEKAARCKEVAKETAARKSQQKAAVVAFCHTIYPTADLLPGRCTTPHDGLADALALAHWAIIKLATGLDDD